MQLPKNTPVSSPVVEGGSTPRSAEGLPPNVAPEGNTLPRELITPYARRYCPANVFPAPLLSPVALLPDRRHHGTIFSMISPLTDAPTHNRDREDTMYLDGRDTPSIPATMDGYDPPAPSGTFHSISPFKYYSFHLQSRPPLVGA